MLMWLIFLHHICAAAEMGWPEGQWAALLSISVRLRCSFSVSSLTLRRSSSSAFRNSHSPAACSLRWLCSASSASSSLTRPLSAWHKRPLWRGGGGTAMLVNSWFSWCRGSFIDLYCASHMMLESYSPPVWKTPALLWAPGSPSSAVRSDGLWWIQKKGLCFCPNLCKESRGGLSADKHRQCALLVVLSHAVLTVEVEGVNSCWGAKQVIKLGLQSGLSV